MVMNQMTRHLSRCEGIASFGGFLARRGEGDPGVRTVWTGPQRVMAFALGIRAIKTEETCVAAWFFALGRPTDPASIEGYVYPPLNF